MDLISLKSFLVEDWIPLKLNKLKDAKVLWASFHSEKLYFGENQNSWNNKLLSSFAYVHTSSKCFKHVAIDNEDSIKGLCERYGGAGIGKNGGGARAITYSIPDLQELSKILSLGNLGVQVKGIGANQLVGIGTSEDHGYGGLDARKAVVEVIYSEILSKVLPLGVVKIHAIIFVDELSGFNGLEACRGVLLVRDGCLRPAHFLKAFAFSPSEEFPSKLPSELARIRRLYKNMYKVYGSHSKFFDFLIEYLDKVANQFSFSLIARISHGTMSPSNLSIDGAWLDLPVSSFLSGGKNYNIWGNFYSEKEDVLAYALEMLYNYCKFNEVRISPNKFIKYYRDRFDFYFRKSLTFIFGLNLEYLPKSFFDAEEWIILSNVVSNELLAGRSIEMNRPTPDDNDPIISLVVGCYLYLRNDKKYSEYLSKSKLDANSTSNLLRCFSWAMRAYKECVLYKEPATSENAIENMSFLIALKRAYLSEAFYLPAVDVPAKEICSNGELGDISEFIQSYSILASWIFEVPLREVTIFKSKRFIVKYSIVDASFYIQEGNNALITFDSFKKLYEYLRGFDSNVFVINSYDYFKFINILLQVFQVGNSQFYGRRYGNIIPVIVN